MSLTSGSLSLLLLYLSDLFEGEVKLAFEQAVEGTTVAMQTMSDEACTACRGTGAKPGTLPKMCPGCDGSEMRSFSI